MPPRRRRVNAGNDSDEIIEVDASGAPVGISARRRKAATFFSLFQRHRELFLAIAACCRPVDLLAVSFSCRSIHSFLKTPASRSAWRASWAQEPGPPPPDCPNRLTPAEWTRLLYGQKCEGCWDRTTRDPDWRLQVRFCSDCQRSQVKRQQRLLQEDRKWQATSQGDDIFRLVPSSKTAARGSSRHSSSFYFWVPHLAQVYERLRSFDDEVDEDPGAARKRTAYVEQRQKIVEDIQNMRVASEEWMHNYRDACVNRDRTVKEARRLRAVEELECEFPVHAIQAALAEEPYFPDPREKAWKMFIKNLKKTCTKLGLAASSGQGVLSLQAAKLQTAWQGYLSNNPHREWEALVPFGDITQLPEVKTRLPTLRDRQMALFAAEGIPGFLAKWREQLEADLLCTLPAGYAPRTRGSHRLKLATSVWRLNTGSIPQVFPDMLLKSHTVTLDCGPLPHALESGPWNLRGFGFDSNGSEVVRALCRLFGLDPDRTTAAEFDEAPYRVHCKRCAEPWPLVLTWRQAIFHTHQSHDAATVSPNDWRRATPVDVSAALSVDIKERQWSCLKCPWDGHSSMKPQLAVKNHLRSIHSVTQPVKGVDFQRSLAAPWVDPVNRLEVHARLVEGQSWACRLCDHEDSLTELLGHLKARHNIPLVPVIVAPYHPRDAAAAPSPASTPVTQRRRQRSLSIESCDYVSSASPTPKLLSELQSTTTKITTPHPHAMSTFIKSYSPRAVSQRFRKDGSNSGLASSSEEEGDIDDTTMAALAHIQHQPSTQRSEPVEPLSQPSSKIASPTLTHSGRGGSITSLSRGRDPSPPTPKPITSTPAAEDSGVVDDDVEMIDSMLGNGDVEDVPMRDLDQPPLDVHTSTHVDGNELTMAVDMTGQFERTREAADQAISTAPREVHNPQGLLNCRICSRLVDRLRRFTSQSMDVHLRTKHDIVAPTFREHYGNAPIEDEYDVMPWQHGVAYQCLLCLRNRKHAPWDFDKLNVHFSAAHRVADPQPGSHFDILPGGLLPSRVRNRRDRRSLPETASDDAAGRREKKVKISTAVLDSRQDVKRNTGATAPNLVHSQCFVCCLCDNGKTYKHPQIVAHVGHHHFVRKPLIRTHYTYLKCRLDIVRRKQKDANTYRFLCHACGETTVLFSSNGVRNHLESRHRFTGREADGYIEDADEILRGGHPSA